jgi:hypothetical protein
MKILLKNNLKLFVLILLITSNLAFISAQKFRGGLLGGLSTSQVDGDTQKGFNKLGLFSGVFVETDFTDVVGAKVELYYIGKGSVKNAGGIEVFKNHFNYIEMPFLLKIVPVKKVVLDFGIAFSYLISAKMFISGEELPKSEVNVHNFDFSGIVSGSYYFTDNWAFNARFDYSLVPVKNNPNWYNSNFSFGFIYRF